VELREQGKMQQSGEKVVAGDGVWWPAVVVGGGWGVCEQVKLMGKKGEK
jgi:hypothetical protein